MSRRVAFCSRLFPGISGHSRNLSAIPRDTPATQKRQSLSTPRSSNNSIIVDNVRCSLAALARDTMSSALHATTMFLLHFVGDACSRESYQFGKWSVRPTGPTRQRGKETAYRRVGMTVQRPKVNCIDGPASRAAHPQKPMAGGNGSADGRGEYHRHSFGLAVVPGGDQTLRILKHLSLGRASARRFLLCGFTALIL
jgi:hypothetical protein